jgi:hemolysin activation/secretion protein
MNMRHRVGSEVVQRVGVARSAAAIGLAGLLACLAVAIPVGAQVPPGPGILDQTIEPQRRPGAPDMAPRPPADIELPERPTRPPKGAEGPKVFVRKFQITGNTVIPATTLESLVRSEEGQELTLEQLRAAAARITDYYAARGYILARAYLPPQDVREGVIEIAILEGKIGDIEVTGNERYKSDVILRALTRVRDGKVVEESRLETAINDLSEYPGLNVRASLKPGAERGTTDILMTAQERLPLSGMADVDNYGSRFTGFWRYGFELGYGNLTGLGDTVSVRGIKSDSNGLSYGRASFLIPIGYYGTKFAGSYVYSENGVGAEFAPLEAGGTLQSTVLEFIQPFMKTAGVNFQMSGGFEAARIVNKVLKAESGIDDLRVFRLGFSGDYRDNYLGRWFYGLNWYQGVPWFGGNWKNDKGASVPNGPGSFSKWTLDLARLQSLVIGGSYLVLRGTGQLANVNMVSYERLAVGGYYTVRGYPLAEYSGDKGYTATAELVVPIPGLREWVQMVAFVDHAGVFPISPDKTIGEKGHFLSGVGGGFRVGVPIPQVLGGTLQVRLDYGIHVGSPKPGSEKSGVGQGIPGIFYLSSSFRF